MQDLRGTGASEDIIIDADTLLVEDPTGNMGVHHCCPITSFTSGN